MEPDILDPSKSPGNASRALLTDDASLILFTNATQYNPGILARRTAATCTPCSARLSGLGYVAGFVIVAICVCGQLGDLPHLRPDRPCSPDRPYCPDGIVGKAVEMLLYHYSP